MRRACGCAHTSSKEAGRAKRAQGDDPCLWVNREVQRSMSFFVQPFLSYDMGKVLHPLPPHDSSTVPSHAGAH